MSAAPDPHDQPRADRPRHDPHPHDHPGHNHSCHAGPHDGSDAAHQRTIAPSPFPDDDGAAHPPVRAALARFADTGESADYLRAVAELCGDRLLIPVVSTATSVAVTGAGLAADKEAEMAVAMLRRPDGGRALLGFTGLDSLRRWDPNARPAPATLDQVAGTAAAESAVAVLVDVAGPHPLVVEGEVLAELAAGHRLVELDEGFGWAMPAVAADSVP